MQKIIMMLFVVCCFVISFLSTLAFNYKLFNGSILTLFCVFFWGSGNLTGEKKGIKKQKRTQHGMHEHGKDDTLATNYYLLASSRYYEIWDVSRYLLELLPFFSFIHIISIHLSHKSSYYYNQQQTSTISRVIEEDRKW